MSEHWDATRVVEWLEPAFDWLDEQWTAAPGTPWADLTDGFLTRLGLEQETDFPVVERLFLLLDEESEQERHRLLSDAADRTATVRKLAEEWEVEQQDHSVPEHGHHEEPVAEVEPKDEATVAAQVVDDVAAAAMREFAEQHPELAASLSPADLRAVLGEAMSVRLAVAAAPGS